MISGFGVFKVYLKLDGLLYEGFYFDYVFVDNCMFILEYVGYVVVKDLKFGWL